MAAPDFTTRDFRANPFDGNPMDWPALQEFRRTQAKKMGFSTAHRRDQMVHARPQDPIHPGPGASVQLTRDYANDCQNVQQWDKQAKSLITAADGYRILCTETITAPIQSLIQHIDLERDIYDRPLPSFVLNAREYDALLLKFMPNPHQFAESMFASIQHSTDADGLMAHSLRLVTVIAMITQTAVSANVPVHLILTAQSYKRIFLQGITQPHLTQMALVLNADDTLLLETCIDRLQTLDRSNVTLRPALAPRQPYHTSAYAVSTSPGTPPRVDNPSVPVFLTSSTADGTCNICHRSGHQSRFCAYIDCLRCYRVYHKSDPNAHTSSTCRYPRGNPADRQIIELANTSSTRDRDNYRDDRRDDRRDYRRDDRRDDRRSSSRNRDDHRGPSLDRDPPRSSSRDRNGRDRSRSRDRATGSDSTGPSRRPSTPGPQADPIAELGAQLMDLIKNRNK